METIARDNAIEDVRGKSQDFEESANPPKNESRERLASARARTQASLRDAYAGVTEIGDEIGIQARGLARSTDRYVHERPWQTLGAGVGVGLLIGYLLGRH